MSGAKCANRCRKQGISESPFYACEAKYSRITVFEAKRLKALEDENAKLKKLSAEQMLNMAAMKELLSKNVDACREPRGCSSSEVPSQAIGGAGV